MEFWGNVRRIDKEMLYRFLKKMNLRNWINELGGDFEEGFRIDFFLRI